MAVNPYDPLAVDQALRSGLVTFRPRPMPHPDARPVRLRRVCVWCDPPHEIEPGDPDAPTSHGMCPAAEARELAKMPASARPISALADSRTWRDAAQVTSLANILETLLAAREARPPRLLAQMSAEEQRRRQAHAHRALRELDGAVVSVAAYRATQAATQVFQERLSPSTPLTHEQLTAVRRMVEAALRAYGATLEGPFARETGL